MEWRRDDERASLDSSWGFVVRYAIGFVGDVAFT